MRRLSRRLSERTRLKSIAGLLVGACLGAGMASVQAGSLLEPGTTIYENDWGTPTYDEPAHIGPAHTVVLAIPDDFFFALSTSFVNEGIVRTETSPSLAWPPQFLAVVSARQVNRGGWYLSNDLTTIFNAGVDNRNGFIQIGANSLLASDTQDFIGGRVHGIANTSKLQANNLKDVTFTGQVNLVPLELINGAKYPGSIGGTLTVDGTLRVNAVNLSESTVLKGAGRTELNNATVGAAPGASAPQLTIEAGHTLSGAGRITDVAVLNQGRLEINANERLRIDSSIVQQGDEAQLVVKGELQAPEIQINGGFIDLHHTGQVTGDVDVRQGRLILHEFNGFDLDNSKIGAAISGNLTLSDQAQLEVIVGHGDPFAFLEVWGAASLDGELIVSFLDGAKAPPTFDLHISANSLQGTFRSVRVNGTGSLPWTFTQNSNGQFTITAVPEPGTWGLMLCGLGVIGWRLRRRAALQTSH